MEILHLTIVTLRYAKVKLSLFKRFSVSVNILIKTNQWICRNYAVFFIETLLDKTCCILYRINSKIVIFFKIIPVKYIRLVNSTKVNKLNFLS